MFYAHFVLSKKGPLARIWLAAHWDKKLTKAHVFDTNIASSVEAIIEPKVKMALRTSGHLLLGVVRIYSRKAKYLLADCNEAFVKIKMAFRPGIVDLPEDNREAALATITLPEMFHDFDTTMGDLNDIDVQAQFSVNQSRPEEITMREDLGNITLVGDDGFGDLGFDEREVLRDVPNGDSLYRSPDASSMMFDSALKLKDGDASSINIHDSIKDDFGGPMADDLMDPTQGAIHLQDPDDDDDDDPGDDNFGGEVDHTLFGDGLIDGANLFEDAPMSEVSHVPEVQEKEKDVGKPTENSHAAAMDSVTAPSTTTVDQTTLVTNEKEAFALEPLDASSIHGFERRVKKRRKLIVDEQPGISSENMKLQLSDSTDILTTLDLAPPTKKLMHWKETGGVEKLFALSGRSIPSKPLSSLFTRNLVTKTVTEDVDAEDVDMFLLEEPEIAREEEVLQPVIEEEPPVLDTTAIVDVSTRSRPSELMPAPETPAPLPPQTPAPQTPAPPTPVPEDINDEIEMPSNLEESVTEAEEEIRWNKRSQQTLLTIKKELGKGKTLSFHEITSRNNRKQAASKFYTFLVLRKQMAINVEQKKPYGDILITKGSQFTKLSRSL